MSAQIRGLSAPSAGKFRNTGAVIARLFVSPALKAEISRFVRQKLNRCSVSMTHGLLQSYAVVVSKPAVLSAFLGNGKERFDVFEDGDTLPVHFITVLPNIDALVVAKAHCAKLPAKELLLFLRRIEADFGGFEHRNRTENFLVRKAYRFAGFKCGIEKVCFTLTAPPFLPASERRGFLAGSKLMRLGRGDVTTTEPI